MRLILLKNKENFSGNSGAIFKKFYAVNRQNQSWPSGLRRPSLLAALKPLLIEPLLTVDFALRINDGGLATKFTPNHNRA